MIKRRRLHPFTTFLYYISLLGMTMFQNQPVLCAISLLSVFWVDRIWNHEMKGKELLFYLVVFVVAALLNPLFQHNGETVLFWLAGNRITLEATVYGIVLATLLLAVLLWCRQLSKQFTSDQSMYLIGMVSPKAALVVSMIFSFVPRYRRQFQEIKAVQKKLGVYGEEALSQRFLGDCKVFLATVTWALEHSMETADGMRAKGYGTGKRTYYAKYHFHFLDGILCFGQIILLLLGFWLGNREETKVYFYPRIKLPEQTVWMLGYELVYTLLCLWIPILTWERTVQKK